LFLDRLDDLVSMAWLIRNLLQNHVAKVSGPEEPHRPSTSSAKAMSSSAKVAESAPLLIVPMSLTMAFISAMATSVVLA
jgi:hypothetical protein